MNEKGFAKGKFQWQEGYGAFAYAKSQRNTVINYIMNQEQHNSCKSFKEEYVDLLNEFEVDYSPEYLFDFFD